MQYSIVFKYLVTVVNFNFAAVEYCFIRKMWLICKFLALCQYFTSLPTLYLNHYLLPFSPLTYQSFTLLSSPFHTFTFLSSDGCGVVRDEMKHYWDEHSTSASQEEMMLDSQASILSQHDIPEMLSFIPELKGKRVLALGAGIG